MIPLVYLALMAMPAPRTIALKVVDKRAGLVMTEPVVHGALQIGLQAENAVARGAAKGETMICRVDEERTPAVIDGEKITLQVLYVTCGDRKFSVAGLSIQ